MARTYIVLMGYAGAYGTKDTIKEHEKELRNLYRSSFVEKMWESCETCRDMRLLDHGYLGALYDLAEEKKCGIRIAIRKIPILQCTVEVCETYGLDPYKLPTYGEIVLTEDPEAFSENLDGKTRAMTATVGYLTEGRDKVITDKTNIEYINKIR